MTLIETRSLTKDYGHVKALDRLDVPFSWTVHPGTAHGFFNETRPAYDLQAASKAWASTLEFLRTTLHTGSSPADGTQENGKGTP